MTTLSRSLLIINSNWFADWFVRLVQPSLSYLIWSCQLFSQSLYQCASHVFFLLHVLSMFCYIIYSRLILL